MSKKVKTSDPLANFKLLRAMMETSNTKDLNMVKALISGLDLEKDLFLLTMLYRKTHSHTLWKTDLVDVMKAIKYRTPDVNALAVKLYAFFEGENRILYQRFLEEEFNDLIKRTGYPFIQKISITYESENK